MTERKIDINRPIQTKDGRKVTIEKSGVGTNDLLFGTIDANDFFPTDYCYWTKDGVLVDINGNPESRYNLVNVPRKYQFYINVFRTSDGVIYYDHSFSDSDFTRQCLSTYEFKHEYVTTVEVEYEL